MLDAGTTWNNRNRLTKLKYYSDKKGIAIIIGIREIVVTVGFWSSCYIEREEVGA
jgi:hypothetical protein